MPLNLEDKQHLLYLTIPLTRVGECDSCKETYKQAWCCSDRSTVEFTTDVLGEEMAEFLIAKGICVKDNRAHFTVRQTCQHYEWDTRKCKIHPTRPKICQRFPVHFAQPYDVVNGTRTNLCSYDWDLDTRQEVGIDLSTMIEVLKLE